jgi:hypothetical protein
LRSSSGLSVVAITSMLNRSNSARGRNAGSQELLGDGVVVDICGLAGQRHVEAEHLLEHMVEPALGRGAAEQVIVLREDAPDLAPVGFGRAAIDPRHAHRLERHALAVDHPEDVVVGE